MAKGQHGFCKRHRIAFNRDLDPVCPQCTLAGAEPGEQLEFDSDAQMPLDAEGRHLDKRTLQPVK